MFNGDFVDRGTWGPEVQRLKRERQRSVTCQLLFVFFFVDSDPLGGLLYIYMILYDYLCNMFYFNDIWIHWGVTCV